MLKCYANMVVGYTINQVMRCTIANPNQSQRYEHVSLEALVGTRILFVQPTEVKMPSSFADASPDACDAIGKKVCMGASLIALAICHGYTSDDAREICGPSFRNENTCRAICETS